MMGGVIICSRRNTNDGKRDVRASAVGASGSMKNKSPGEEKKVSVLLMKEIVVFARRRRRKNHGK